MPNLAQGGLRWVRSKTGVKTPPMEIWPVASGYATGLFRGDLVKFASDGTIQACAAGNTPYGVLVGADQYVEAGVLRKGGNFLPASTTFSPSTVGSVNESRVRVIPGKFQIFEVDADDATSITTIAAAYNSVGENADIAVGAGGNTTTGVSTHILDISTHATTNTLVLRIVGVQSGPTNDVTAINAKYLVEFNLSQEPPFTSTGT